MSGLEQLDKALTLVINSHHSPSWDTFWQFMSSTWYPLYVLVIVLLIWRLGWKKGLIYILAAALSILCIDQMCNIVKDSVCRLRPCFDPDMLDGGVHIFPAPDPARRINRHAYGFFSAHAANSFGFAMCSYLALRQAWKTKNTAGDRRTAVIYGVFIFAWAVTVSLSRIFLAKHFLGDIVVGAVAGCAVSLVFCLLARKIILRLGY